MNVSAIPTHFLIYSLAALSEIGGCYAVWAVLRNGAPKPWLLVGVCLLVIFAWLLTLIPSASAGRAFAAYGGIYIVASLGAMWFVERHNARCLGYQRWFGLFGGGRPHPFCAADSLGTNQIGLPLPNIGTLG